MTSIASLRANSIPDSRGVPTIEVEVRLESGAKGIASVPQGKSRGTFEAKYLELSDAIRAVEEVVSRAFRRRAFETQEKFDAALLALDGTPYKSRLGANAMLGLSFAFARASAEEQKMPLWRFIRGMVPGIRYSTPRFLVNLIGGGLHANNRLAFQEYLVIPKTRDAVKAWELSEILFKAVGAHLKKRFGSIPLADEGNFAPPLMGDGEPFSVMKEVAQGLGVLDDVEFGLDAAANQVKQNPETLSETYQAFMEKFPLRYLEDPFPENDFEGFAKLLHGAPKGTYVVGDDLTVTNVGRIEAAYQAKSVNGVIIKPNQIGTLSEAINAVKKVREYGWGVFVSHRSGETNDDFLADFAYGIGADGLKAGAPLAPERMVKYKRLVEIEKSLSL